VDVWYPPDLVDQVSPVSPRIGDVYAEVGLVSDLTMTFRDSALPDWRRLARLSFRTDAAGPLTFYSQPGRTRFESRSGEQIPWSDVAFGSVTVFAAIPGDANADGQVSLADFGLLKASFGQAEGASLAQGDFDANGTVDLTDFGILKANFGSGGLLLRTQSSPTADFVAAASTKHDEDEKVFTLLALAAAQNRTKGGLSDAAAMAEPSDWKLHPILRSPPQPGSARKSPRAED
jgi:hypothetical protein